MTNTQVTILISVLTILTSGVMSAAVTFLLNSKRDEKLFLRKKLEALYKAVNLFSLHMVGDYLHYHSIMVGKLTYNQALDLTIEQGEKTDSKEFHSIEMVIGIYFPKLQKYYDSLIESRDRLSVIKGAHRKQYETGDLDGTKFATELSAELMRLNIVTKAFLRGIIKHSRKLNKPFPASG